MMVLPQKTYYTVFLAKNDIGKIIKTTTKISNTIFFHVDVILKNGGN